MIASRLHWRLLIGTILILMATAWVAPRLLRHPPGLKENRILASAPAWPKGFGDLDRFRKDADAYVADRFPARPYLISALNRLRMMVGVSGSDRVIVGRDGWLFFDTDAHLGAARNDPPMLGPEIRSWLMVFAGRTEYLRARHIPYFAVTAPVKEVIYPQFGPPWYHGPAPDRPGRLLPRLAARAGAGEVIDLYPALATATRQGIQTYSRHDTHWNGYGAYAGYVALMSRLHALGLTEGPLPRSAFVWIPGGQGGDQPRDLALMLGVADKVRVDFPHVVNPRGEARIHRTFLGPKTDWTAPQVLDTGETGKPILLMTRDSFSNELLPLLYSHFSRIVLAHNQDGPWRPDLVERFKPDIVLYETIEHGLRVGMGTGPQPSAAAVARIDAVLGTLGAPPSIAPVPTLAPPDRDLAAALASARPTDNCNIEIAKLTPGERGEANLSVSGWLSELGAQVTSPHGEVALAGPGGLIVSPVEMNRSRPDVAAFFRNPTAELSGFSGTFFVRKLTAGTYTPMVYRRAGGGWIACRAKQPVTMP